MRGQFFGLAAAIAALSPAWAQSSAPATIYHLKEAQGALTDNQGPGFALKPLHAADHPGAYVTIATLRRVQGEKAGLSHDHVTEVYQILDGDAELVTGGSFTGDVKILESIAADPFVGPSRQGAIQDGKTAHVGVGDIVIIMPGTPHVFSHIDGHITYMVTRFSDEKYGP
jgi:mannose-6-phosphate isomerase-like protein (cupin superfamily)